MIARKRRLKKDDELDELHARLVAWGRWVRGGMPHLTLSRTDPGPTTWDADDVQLVEFTMTTWALTSLRGEMYTFTLKLHYAEGWGAEDDMRNDFRKRFNAGVSRAKFYRMLAEAKHDLGLILPDIGTPLIENRLQLRLRSAKIL